MQCSNCSEPALYVYDPRGLMPAYFCAAHVPSFLSKAAKAGQLKSTEYYESLKVSVLQSMRPPSEEPQSEAAEDGQPASQEVAAPPRKRRNRRKAETTASETIEASDESSPEVAEADGED